VRICAICNTIDASLDRTAYAHGWIKVLTGPKVYDLCPVCAAPFKKLLGLRT
jgi:hypothetical protein